MSQAVGRRRPFCTSTRSVGPDRSFRCKRDGRSAGAQGRAPRRKQAAHATTHTQIEPQTRARHLRTAAHRRPPPAAAGKHGGLLIVKRSYDVTVVYPGHGAQNFCSIGRGEFAFITGPTGCGKLTLIKMLIRDLSRWPGPRRSPARTSAGHAGRPHPDPRRRIGRLPGTPNAFDLARTVYDKVADALQVIGDALQDPPLRRGARDSPAVGRRWPPTTRRALGRRAAAHADRPRGSAPATRRCCSPTSSTATSTPRPRSGSCSCSTGSTSPVRPCSSSPITAGRSTRCAAGDRRSRRPAGPRRSRPDEDESTKEFAARVRETVVGDEGGTNGRPAVLSTETATSSSSPATFPRCADSDRPSIAAIVTIVITTRSWWLPGSARQPVRASRSAPPGLEVLPTRDERGPEGRAGEVVDGWLHARPRSATARPTTASQGAHDLAGRPRP